LAGDDKSILVPGVVIAADLDRFEEVTRERGWSRWKPNEATGLLTRLAEAFARKWRGVIVYGVDEARGTEEFVIEIPLTRPEEVMDDLRTMVDEVRSLGVTLSIAIVEGSVGLGPARTREEAYYATPARRAARALLRRAKRMGGGVILRGHSL